VSVRVNPLWDQEGRPSAFMVRQWVDKGALTSLHSRIAYLTQDRTATPHFRTAWEAAFPDRDPLPKEAIADRAGRGTDRFWDLFE